MPITRHFVSAKNFVLTKMSGTVNEALLRTHLRAMNDEAAQYSALIELVDSRGMECVGCRSIHDVLDLAALEKGQPWATNGRLAIVVAQPVVFGMARAYLVGVEGIRKDVQLTYNLDKALDWLGIELKLIGGLVR
jgi:hypothetical protein